MTTPTPEPAIGDAYTMRLTRYESAVEVLAGMAGIATHRVVAAKAAQPVNDALVRELEAQVDGYVKERYALRMENDQAVEYVLSQYGPVLRAAYAAQASGTAGP